MPANTFATFPTRSFSFLVDPTAFPKLGAAETIGVIHLIQDIGSLECPIDVKLLWPTYIDGRSPAHSSEALAILLRGHLSQVRGGRKTRRFVASKYMDETARAMLSGESAEDERRRSLLALADDAQADGLVTADSVLIERRYDLLQHHRLRIVPISEFADVIEVVAHGHSIFWSATDSGRRLTIDLYYQAHHWKQKRLASWYWTKGPTLESDLRDNVHSALINRYALIAYTRDMVRFYELQLDYFHRRGLGRRFGTLLGYHMTNFYLYLWGMLEHLTLIANQVKRLGLRERRCGIESKELWEALGENAPALRAYIRGGPILEWIGHMADARHAAAHRAMLLPTDAPDRIPVYLLRADIWDFIGMYGAPYGGYPQASLPGSFPVISFPSGSDFAIVTPGGGGGSTVVGVPELSIGRAFAKHIGGVQLNAVVNPWLQRLTAWSAAKILGAPSDGIYVRLPNVTLEVQEWCSGLVTTKWLMLFALVLGVVGRLGVAWTTTLVLAAMITGLEVNVLRVAAIGYGYAEAWLNGSVVVFGVAQVGGLGLALPRCARLIAAIYANASLRRPLEGLGK